MKNHSAGKKIPSNIYKHALKVMRITFFLVFFSILFSHAAGIFSQETKLTLNLQSATIKEVCKEVEKRSDYVFVFSDEAITSSNKRISISIDSKNIDEVLDKVLLSNGLGYAILEKQIVVYKDVKGITSQMAEEAVSTKSIEQQKKTIKGRVVGVDGEAIIGANIIEVGTTNGTVTDIDGRFTLSVANNSVIRVTYIGYLEQQIKTSARNSIDIILLEDTQALDELVVVGYSSQKKVTLTGAISNVKNDDLLLSTNANIANTLVGRVPGITAIQASGEAGQGAATLRIRGVGTFNSGGQEPLIVIDGVQSSSSVFNALDPNEISAISVLKDASSTAIYGVKGANGVIIVATKRGASNTPKINVSYRYGFSKLTSKLETVNSYDYAVFRNEAIRNDKISSNYQFLFTEDELWKFKNNRDYTPEEIAAMDISNEKKQLLSNSPALYYRSMDYVDEIFGGSAPQSQFNINLSGGGDKLDYFVSLGQFTEEGVLNNASYAGKDFNSTYNRYNLRSNLDVKPHQNIKVSLDFGAQFYQSVGTTTADGTANYFRYREMWNSIFGNPPFAGPGILDGKLVNSYSQETNPLASKGSNGHSVLYTLYTRDMAQRNSSNMSITGNLELNLDFILSGLSLSGMLSYNDTYSKGTRYSQPVPVYGATRNPLDPSEILFFGGATSPTVVTDNMYMNKWNRIYYETKLNYSNTFGNHAFSGLLLYNVQTTRYPSLEYNVAQNFLGTAGRVTYAYKGRYLGEFNMAYNGSENFPPGKRFGFFPSFSLGWILSDEAFFPKDSFISWLKFRGSYGLVGNDQIGGSRFLYLPNSWYAGWNGLLGGYPFGNSDGTTKDPHYNGYMEDQVGNPNVTWEKAKKLNVGVDLNLFQNRLTFTGDYFQEKRNNILWKLGTIPGIVAADLAPANIGEVSNRGYELTMGWQDKINKFSYGINFNLSYAQNKIEFMDEPSYKYEWMNTTGFSVGQNKGFKMDGFYNNTAEASNRPYIEFDGNQITPGDIRYIDINGDGVINAEDQIPMGYPNLPLYSFSSNMYLAYKGFSLNLLFNGTRGGSIIMNSLYISNPFYTVHGNALQYQFDGRWTPEKVAQGIIPSFPRASIRTIDSQNGKINDIWLRSTEFIRLKNIELAYTFTNVGKLKRIGISGIKIYTNGMNLYTWGSKLIDGYDPEQMSTSESTSGFLYPPTKSYNLGINLQF